MKMTIVLDTSDVDGLKDAHKIASMLLRKHAGYNDIGKPIFSKIELIKLVREYGKECQSLLAESEEIGEVPSFSGLRFAKRFIDARMDGFKKMV